MMEAFPRLVALDGGGIDTYYEVVGVLCELSLYLNVYL